MILFGSLDLSTHLDRSSYGVGIHYIRLANANKGVWTSVPNLLPSLRERSVLPSSKDPPMAVIVFHPDLPALVLA